MGPSLQPSNQRCGLFLKPRNRLHALARSRVHGLNVLAARRPRPALHVGCMHAHGKNVGCMRPRPALHVAQALGEDMRGEVRGAHVGAQCCCLFLKTRGRQERLVAAAPGLHTSVGARGFGVTLGLLDLFVFDAAQDLPAKEAPRAAGGQAGCLSASRGVAAAVSEPPVPPGAGQEGGGGGASSGAPSRRRQRWRGRSGEQAQGGGTQPGR